MFWDIETTTPENDNKTSEIQKTSIPYMISVIYKDRQDTIRKYIICTKQFEQTKQADYEYIYKDTELKLINCFGKLIQHYRPDIITGFNDYKFDWYVIINRLIQLDHNSETAGQSLINFYKSIDVCYDQKFVIVKGIQESV